MGRSAREKNKKRKASRKKEAEGSKKRSSDKQANNSTKTKEAGSGEDGKTKQPKKGGKKDGAGKGDKGKDASKDDENQLTIFGAGFQKIDQEPLYCTKLVLLTDAIFGKKVPTEFMGMLFAYKVSKYDSESKKFTLKYQNRMIKEDGVEWEFQDGGRALLKKVEFPAVKEGDKLYQKALGCIRAHQNKNCSVAVVTLDTAADDGGGKKKAFDFSDLDEAALVDEAKGWRSEHVTDVSKEMYFSISFIRIRSY